MSESQTTESFAPSRVPPGTIGAKANAHIDGTNDPHIRHLQNLLLKCQNLRVVAETDPATFGDMDSTLRLEVLLKRHTALIELNRIPECHELIGRILSEAEAGQSPLSIYALGRFRYLMKRTDESELLFQSLLEKAGHLRRWRVAAQFGLGSVAWSRNDRASVTRWTTILDHDDLDEAEGFHLQILKARFSRAVLKEVDAAEALYWDITRKSMQSGFQFFHLHGLYGLALCAKERGDSGRLSFFAELLEKTINPAESPFLLWQFNEDCASEKQIIRETASFDDARMVMHLGTRSIELISKPLIFGFLKLMSEHRDRFVTKDEIARALWRNEEYHPFIHDPRIFDVVQRTRKCIEVFEDRPVVLLSGRMGYRIAIK